MTPSLTSSDAIAARVPRPTPRKRSSIEGELAVLAEELAAARELYVTFDPDCPPWSVEAEMRRLELRWHVLVANVSPPSSPGGDTAQRVTRSLASATRRGSRPVPI